MSELLYRLGKFSARRAWTVIIAWVMALGLSVGVALTAGGTFTSAMTIDGLPAQATIDKLQTTFPDASRGVGQIIVHTTDGSEFTAADETAARASVLTATENGYGKRTNISEYTRHGRGTKGMIAIQQSERNGKVVAATLVQAEDEIMLITDTGVLVRTRVAEIREMGRATQGVTLIGLDEGAKLSGLQRIVENDANATDSAEDNATGDEA